TDKNAASVATWNQNRSEKSVAFGLTRLVGSPSSRTLTQGEWYRGPVEHRTLARTSIFPSRPISTRGIHRTLIEVSQFALASFGIAFARSRSRPVGRLAALEGLSLEGSMGTTWRAKSFAPVGLLTNLH